MTLSNAGRLLTNVCSAQFIYNHGRNDDKKRGTTLGYAVARMEPAIALLAGNAHAPTIRVAADWRESLTAAIQRLNGEETRFRTVSTNDAAARTTTLGTSLLERLRERFPALAAQEQTPPYRVIRETLGMIRGSRSKPLDLGPNVSKAMAVAATDAVIAPIVYALGLLCTAETGWELHDGPVDDLATISQFSQIAIPLATTAKGSHGDWILLTA